MRLAEALCDLLLIGVAAMRAIWAARPADRLKGFAGLVFVSESWVLNVSLCHG